MGAIIKTYHPALWRKIRPTFCCDICGTYRDEEDAMIEHVLLHYPLARQEELFNLMLKEKENGTSSNHSTGN